MTDFSQQPPEPGKSQASDAVGVGTVTVDPGNGDDTERQVGVELGVTNVEPEPVKIDISTYSLVANTALLMGEQGVQEGRQSAVGTMLLSDTVEGARVAAIHSDRVVDGVQIHDPMTEEGREAARIALISSDALPEPGSVGVVEPVGSVVAPGHVPSDITSDAPAVPAGGPLVGLVDVGEEALGLSKTTRINSEAFVPAAEAPDVMPSDVPVPEDAPSLVEAPVPVVAIRKSTAKTDEAP